MDMSEYILEMKKVYKEFPGVIALNNVDLKVKKGSVHAIVGENGAGKSTLMKVLCGVISCDRGEILLKGKKANITDIKDAGSCGITMIYQELNCVLDMTIMENIFLGREPKTRIGFVDFKEMKRRTEEILKSMELGYSPEMKMRELKVADMQMIEIVKAISKESEIVVMDEPTSALSEREIEKLFEQIRFLKQKGVSVIYISHKLEELFEIADDVTIIRDGQCIESGKMHDYDKAGIIALMVGRTIENTYPKEQVSIREPVLEVRGLSRKGVFENISFSVRKGEIVGIAGLMGAGRTEIARAVFGLDEKDKGEIYLEGKKVLIKKPADAIKKGIAMVPEDRKAQGLILCRSVKENITLVNLKKYKANGLLSPNKEKAVVREIKEKLKIKFPDMDAAVSSLSGGNQQKVVLAKFLISDIKVILLDEPTRGIDVGAKYEIYKLMCELAAMDIAVVMISSEMPELIGMCDRVIVMHEGRLKGELQRCELTQEKIMTLAAGA